MELKSNVRPSEKRYNAHGAIPLIPGQEFKIEIDGTEILKAEVPAGEEWEVGVDINVIVRDVA